MKTRTSPRKKQKLEDDGSKLFRGKALLQEVGEDADAATPTEAASDVVAEEIELWNFLSPESYSEYYDEDGLLNEFEMMWALRDRFSLHFVVFKQMATHLAHEANVEQVFSRAGLLSDPNINADYLARLVMVSVNKKAFRPSLKDIEDAAA